MTSTESVVAGLVPLLAPGLLWVPGRRTDGDPLGEDLPRFSWPEPLSPAEQEAADAAWAAFLAAQVPSPRAYVRVRVDTADDVRRLRAVDAVDGLPLVPSLDSPGGQRGFEWRWPIRVAVLPGAATEGWLDALQHTDHHGTVFDAVEYDGGPCEIVLTDVAGLQAQPDDVRAVVDATPCVLVADPRPPEEQLQELGQLVAPPMVAAFAGHPGQWWPALLFELAHDSPLDVAAEMASRRAGVDALLAGPRRGLDITAPMHWFVTAAASYAELGPLDGIEQLDWQHEGGGSTDRTGVVRAARAAGVDPMVSVPSAEVLAEAAPEFPEFAEAEEPPEAPEPPAARRLVVRVRHGQDVVATVLPPRRKVKLLIRVAIPQEGDVASDRALPPLPEAPGQTVQLDVVVRGDVWRRQPAPRPIVLSRERTDQASTWAEFGFTTLADGKVVTIDVTLLHQGKPFQAATYVAPVRTEAVDPDERPTLTHHNVSGPDEPTEDARPVDIALDGTGLELTRLVGGGTRKVPIDDVQEILDALEDRISRVTADRQAPQTMEGKRTRELLIEMARMGVQLRRLLRPLDLDATSSINVTVSDSTPVLPFELVYAGPAPQEKTARLCEHVDVPPPPGQGCDRTDASIVCPYAFWGSHRTITRTIQWDGDPLPLAGAASGSPFAVLYASTSIADDGARAPLPGDQVLAAAKQAFAAVTRVKTWPTWRKQVARRRPRLLVILGHSVVVGVDAKLFIGKDSALSGVDLTAADLCIAPGPRPLVLLIACKSAAIGNAFGTLPGVLTAEGAGAVVGTLATITGTAGATAAVHLLTAYQEAARARASVGDMVAAARRSLLAEKRIVGLILVSHGEVDTRVEL